jgi:hypothetical protein
VAPSRSGGSLQDVDHRSLEFVGIIKDRHTEDWTTNATFKMPTTV